MTDNIKDIEKLTAFRNGDTKALEKLMSDYRGLVNILARPYYLVGADYEDLVQEGWLGLYQATIGFDLNGKATFYSYAYSCVKNKILDALKAANRDKNKLLNEAVSFSTLDEGTILSYSTPEQIAIEKEQHGILKKRLVDNLSKNELMVLTLYLRGESYKKIAELVNKNEKDIDNCLQRIKKKIKKDLERK